MASDEIDGETVTFHHASPHVVMASVGSVSASVTVEIGPTAVVTPPTTDPTAPAAEPTALAALLAVHLGRDLRTAVQRSCQRS